MACLFNWNESFLTGLCSVDEQHRKLVGLINELGELVTAADLFAKDKFVSVRQAVVDYTRVHFSDEESFMESGGLDPRFCEQHRLAHRDFVAELCALSSFDEGLAARPAGVLVDYLIGWLAYHILGIDQSMARQLRAIENGMSAAQAFESDRHFNQSGAEPLLGALRVLFETVSRRNAELRILNSELEERIRERTTELELANSQLQLLSTMDELTGLPNRRYATLAMRQLWEEAKRYSSPLSVLMLDADRFKEVNDRFGHAEGDALLRALAKRLRQAVRASDIVCRLGGDEFLVICPRTTLSGAQEVGNKILSTQQAFFTDDQIECWSGLVSIGVAEIDHAMNDADELLKAADRAMYVSKRLRGGRLTSAGRVA